MSDRHPRAIGELAFDLMPEVGRRILRERHEPCGRILDGRDEHLAARHVDVAIVDGSAIADIGLVEADGARRTGRRESEKAPKQLAFAAVRAARLYRRKIGRWRAIGHPSSASLGVT